MSNLLTRKVLMSYFMPKMTLHNLSLICSQKRLDESLAFRPRIVSQCIEAIIYMEPFLCSSIVCRIVRPLRGEAEQPKTKITNHLSK